MTDPGRRYPHSPEELRRIRETELHLSIKALARRLGYGFSTVQRYETGESRIPPEFFADFETLRAAMAREREAEAARKPGRPTRPEAAVVLLELPVDVAVRLHAALGDALVRRGQALASGEQVGTGSGNPESVPLAVVINPGMPLPCRFRAVLLRKVFERQRCLPSSVSAHRFPLALYVPPLAVLVSRPEPVVPHPMARLRRAVRNPRPMLPPMSATTVRASAGVHPPDPFTSAPSKPSRRRFRMSERIERRLTAASLMVAVIGSTAVIAWVNRQTIRALDARLVVIEEVLLARAQETPPAAEPPGSSSGAGVSDSFDDAPWAYREFRFGVTDRVQQPQLPERQVRRMPGKLLNGQKPPPCAPDSEVEKGGGCWWKLDVKRCPDDVFRDGDGCYYPVPDKEKGKNPYVSEPRTRSQR